MGGAPPAGKVAARRLQAGRSSKAEQGCRKRKRDGRATAGRGRSSSSPELPPRIGPSQNGGPHLARQSIEGGAATVLFERREQIEQRHRLRLAGDGDAAVDQPREPGAADRRDLDDRVAPIAVTAARGDDEGAEDRGSRPARIEPGDRAAREPLVGGAARQDGDLGAVMMVIGSRPADRSGRPRRRAGNSRIRREIARRSAIRGCASRGR